MPLGETFKNTCDHKKINRDCLPCYNKWKKENPDLPTSDFRGEYATMKFSPGEIRILRKALTVFAINYKELGFTMLEGDIINLQERIDAELLKQ